MGKSEATVEELVGKVERGELQLPEMQRRYVWRSTRVRDLIDSLYRGYPSGAILIWETDEDVPIRDFAVEQEKSPYLKTQLLLDGQQRLTSLSAVIRGRPIEVKGRRRPIELLFNLEHPEGPGIVSEVQDIEEDEDIPAEDIDANEDELSERFNRMAFVVSTKKLEQQPHWVKVSDVFNNDDLSDILIAAGVDGFKDPRYKKYSDRLSKLKEIRKYVYRMDILERSLTYDEVTEIFVRVNSLGAKLRRSDLALAQITAKWRGALSTFQAFQDECKDTGFDIELGLHLRNLVAFITGQCKFLTVNTLNLKTLQDGWKQAVEGLEFSINFIKNNVKIESPSLFSSLFLLVSVGYYGHKRNYDLSKEEIEGLRHWALLVNVKGRYSRGSSETLLDQDLSTIKNGGGVDELIDRLRLQVGKIDISPGELEGRNQRSAIFKTMFLAFKNKGAQDWNSNIQIALNHSGAQHKLQFHHIFPKAVLKKAGFPNKEINDIANLSFIGAKTNKRINDKPPSKYLPGIIDKNGVEALTNQCIPTDKNLWEIENYKEFLIARRILIANELNRFIAE